MAEGNEIEEPSIEIILSNSTDQSRNNPPAATAAASAERFTEDLILASLEEIFYKLKVRLTVEDDPEETSLAVRDDEWTIGTAGSMPSVDRAEIRRRLYDLFAELTTKVMSTDVDLRTLRHKLHKILCSSAFDAHLPRFLMRSTEDDHALLQMLKNLAAIYTKARRLLFGSKVLMSLHLQLLVCKDAAKRLCLLVSSNDSEVAQQVLTDFEGLFNSKCDDTKANFRKIPIYPTASDLLFAPRYLRANIVDGRYESVNDYLDVQFRLLREDLIGPLRDALHDCSFNHDDGPKTIVYSDVIMTNPIMTNEGVAFLLCSDDFRSMRDHNNYIYGYEEDDDDYMYPGENKIKKLLDGSLLCISNDDFQNNFCMAVVVRNSEHGFNDNGTITVIFMEPYATLFNEKRADTFKVIVCPSYYEAYRHVLAGLKSLNESNFPFKKYFVDVKADVSPPSYLERGSTYKLGPHDQSVDILDSSSWPSPEELGFDEAQWRAFKSALTKELAIIQGPPGTGKTFIGLKIIETLLKNEDIWKNRPKICNYGPILIVCFTNHALDQFLKGILKFCPNGVIRVGGRSKSSDINKCSLFAIRNDKKNDVQSLMEERNLLYGAMDEYRRCVRELQTESWRLKPTVLSKKELKEFILLEHYVQFKEPDSDSRAMHYLIMTPVHELHKWLEVLEVPVAHRWTYSSINKDLIKHRMESNDSMTASEVLAVTDLWQLPLDDRWKLYRHWLGKKTAHGTREAYKIGTDAQDVCVDLVRNMQKIDVSILRSSRVIGMTTTGAAKNFRLLSMLAPRIMIIDEAAQVLEANALLTINSICEHIIMIGDQQQLRPNCSNYELAKNYNFDVSLFERLIYNGIPYDTLTLQHRMRPIISALLTPHIYKELKNYPSVETYENIRGVASNMFFVDHRQPEETGKSQSTSHSNRHEAHFITGLCNYLIKQGYEPNRITVLTPYVGQLKLLMREMDPRVRIAAIDSFQGDENDIILLSLVRSNPDGSIGYLQSMNRICVLLSRARMGFFCIGNFECLATHGYDWLPVIRYLYSVRCIGPSVKLACQNHPTTITEVATSNDFMKVPLGGCLLPCNAELPCGHRCTLTCHGYDRNHVKFKCMETCTRKCAAGLHDCFKPHKCYMKCDPCPINTSKVYSDCGHLIILQCRIALSEVPCKEAVWRLHSDCGHKAMLMCDENLSEVPCTVPVLKAYPDCSHTCTILCHEDLVDVPCLAEVIKVHPKCGRESVLPCSQNTSGQFGCHFFCSEKLTCGHPCPVECGIDCSTANCLFGFDCHKHYERHMSCSRVCEEQFLNNGITCQKTPMCGHPCSEGSYSNLVFKSTTPSFGHEVAEPFVKVNDWIKLLRGCSVPCLEELPCGHLCEGNCGDCAQGRFHVECRVHCERRLVCGHRFAGPCSVETNKNNCSELCEFVCGHSVRCQKPCSSQCVQCNSKCVWKCEHFACTRKCYEVCDRPPCNANCPRQLPCGHPCVGLCGEACPPFCKVCDGQPDVFFGTEEDDGARFVLLPDCGHVFEVKSLDKWMRVEVGAKNDVDQLFTAKRCPKCDVLVCRAVRYNGVIKKFQREMSTIKLKVFKERKYVTVSFAEMLDLWKSPYIPVMPTSYYKKESIALKQLMRQLLTDLWKVVAKTSELHAFHLNIAEKIFRMNGCLRSQLPTAIDTANFHRECLRIWYLLSIANYSHHYMYHNKPCEGIENANRCFELLTSTHQFTLLIENDVRQLCRSKVGTGRYYYELPIPKPLKQFIGWRQNWFVCATCSNVYCKSGFLNITEDEGCTVCKYRA